MAIWKKRKLKKSPLILQNLTFFLGNFAKKPFSLGFFKNSQMVNFLPQNAPAIQPASQTPAQGFFFFSLIFKCQFCDVAKVVMLHRKI